MITTTIVAGLVAAPLFSAPVLQDDAPSTSWTIHADTLYVSPGKVVEDALIRVQDGKILSVTPGGSASDSLHAVAVTAGMIDASARIGAEGSVEESSEVITRLSVLDSIDPFDPQWLRQARAGVTTAHVTPVDRNVIGGRTAVVKTAGKPSVEARQLRGRPILRGAQGSLPSVGNSPAFGQPTTFFNRRPTTRMGVEWEWRKSFFDAAMAERFPEAEFEGADVLRAVLAGEIALSVDAWTTADIRTAVFVVEEMQREGLGTIDMIVDSAAEAWIEPELLVRSKASVVLPPHPANGRTNDGAFMAWKTAADLVARGVPVALSAHGDTRLSGRLSAQVAFAMRGGLSFQDGLAAVTTVPAKMLGITDRVGTVEVGKDADLVLWTGTPFELTSGITGVLVGGELVRDPR